MGEGGERGGGTLSKINQDYPPPPPPPAPTVYTQFINNPCTRMLSTRMLSSVLLSTLRVCLCAYALWSLEITMDSNIYHIP